MAKSTEVAGTPSVKELQKQLWDANKTIASMTKEAEKTATANNKALDAVEKKRGKDVAEAAIHASQKTREALLEQLGELELEPKVAKAVEKVVKSFRYPGEGRKGKEA